MSWVIIPDIHGDPDRMSRMLSAAGFFRHRGGWRSDESKALFLGDLIDKGERGLEVVSQVRATVEDGEGMCIMGNHELNAVMLHRGLRERSRKNTSQHAAFLSEAPFGSREANDVVAWFADLPLHADFSEFRAVHAYWSEEAFSSLSKTRTDFCVTTRISSDEWADVAAERGDVADAVLDALKGPELIMPSGSSFTDIYGHERTSGRFRWWGVDFPTWESAFASMPSGVSFPAGKPVLRRGAPAYPDTSKPLYVGHYKMTGDYAPLSINAFCLDYPHLDVWAVRREDDAQPAPDIS